MQQAGIEVPVYIDAKTFRDFALFDSFYRQRRWKPLALFTGILLCSAFICFIMRNQVKQAVFLGSVLTIVSLGLPAVYYLSFLSSVKQQSKKMRLTSRRHAYTLTFNAAEGITAKTGKEQLSYRWEEVYAVYRVHHYTYLYVSQQKAYLLPDAQVEGGADVLWQLLKSTVIAGRLFDRLH